MNDYRFILPVRFVLALVGALSLMIVSSCGEQSTSPQTSVTGSTTVAKKAEVSELPSKGKISAATAPSKAVFGMIWINKSQNREYIFDGADWVPHDNTVDSFYAAKAKNSAKTVALAQDEVCVDGDPACTPTGAHGKHGNFDCKVCHNVGGRLAFAKTGTNSIAYSKVAGLPVAPFPTFNATTKTCSNVACHGVPAGTFSYYFPGGDGEPVLNTVTYGGTVVASTPSWYATGSDTCSACHGNAPTYGSSGGNAWHSRSHAGTATSPTNQCQFCHPDASSPGNAVGDTITNTALHANGVVNVQATFKTSCFGCH